MGLVVLSGDPFEPDHSTDGRGQGGQVGNDACEGHAAREPLSPHRRREPAPFRIRGGSGNEQPKQCLGHIAKLNGLVPGFHEAELLPNPTKDSGGDVSPCCLRLAALPFSLDNLGHLTTTTTWTSRELF